MTNLTDTQMDELDIIRAKWNALEGAVSGKTKFDFIDIAHDDAAQTEGFWDTDLSKYEECFASLTNYLTSDASRSYYPEITDEEITDIRDIFVSVGFAA